MGYPSSVLALLATCVFAADAASQSCVPHPLPGPPLIQSDLTDLRGGVVLGPDGLVRHSDAPPVLLLAPGRNVVEVRGQSVELPGRIGDTGVRCASSIVAYVTGPWTLRLLHAQTGATRDLEVPFEGASLTQVSDGSVWYRLKDSPSSAEGIRWLRQSIEGEVDTVRTPTDTVLLDAFGERVLVSERRRNATGGRVARIVLR